MFIPKPLPDVPSRGTAFSVRKKVGGGMRRLPRFGVGSARSCSVLPGQASAPSRTGLLCQVRQETCGDSLPRRRDAAKRCSGVCSSPVTRLLQQYVSGPEEERRDETHHQPKVLEQCCREREVQDGNPAGHQEGSPAGRLGNLNRPQGCLFPHSHQTSVPQVSPLHSGERSVPVQGSPIWPHFSAEGVYQGHVDPGVNSPPERHQSPFVSRRLASASQVFREMPSTDKGSRPGHDGSRFHCESGEVRPGTDAEVLLPGRGLRLGGRTGATYPRKGRENPSPVQNSQKASVSGGEISSESLGRDECSCRCHPSRQVAHAPTTAVPTQPVVNVHATFVMQGVPKQLLPGTPQLVELSGEPARRTASAFAQRDGGTLYGQFHDGVGGNPQHSPYGSRSLGPDDVRLTQHQLAGAQDSAPGDSALSGSPQTSVSDDQIGQPSHDLQFGQAGGHTFPGIVLPGLGDSPVVSPTQNPGSSPTPDGRTQCSGGSAQPIPQGDTDGMVPVSKGIPRYRKRVRRPRHRPVRHSPEPSDPGLHQPVPGPECPSPGRSQRRLELSSSGLRLSTDADLAEGPPEDPAIIGQHHPGGSGMADPVLVSGPTQSLHGSPTRDSGRSGPPLADGATQDLDAPQPGNVQLPRLDVVRDSLTARGFSQAAADRIAVPQRSSTRSIYDGKWAEFCSWCSRKKTDPVKATIPIVADFLVHLFERRPPLAVSTIRGYRSAISSTWYPSHGRHTLQC